MRVLRIYHAGRDPRHRSRERALAAAGIDVTLLVPSIWPDEGGERKLSDESFRVSELAVRRPGDVMRHQYVDARAFAQLIRETRPDVVDIHEEAFSVLSHQALALLPRDVPVVMYAAQNIDKRLPPPFSGYERVAHRRVASYYPCSRQAASRLRGTGFAGLIEVLPLGYEEAMFTAGSQSLDADELVIMIVGRLIPEKGIDDAVRVLAGVNAFRPARLVVSGRGPEEERARNVAAWLGVTDRVEFVGWQSGPALAASYRRTHVVLVPSRPSTVAEQFGRVIVEAQAAGAVVAGYACGAIAEVAGAAAIVVPTGDVGRLGELVTRLLCDPDEFAGRREEGRTQSAGRTWESVARAQVALYERVLADPLPDLALPRSPLRRRSIARAEFGQTAVASGGIRPFALPILRRGGPLPRVLGAMVDAMAEVLHSCRLARERSTE